MAGSIIMAEERSGGMDMTATDGSLLISSQPHHSHDSLIATSESVNEPFKSTTQLLSAEDCKGKGTEELLHTTAASTEPNGVDLHEHSEQLQSDTHQEQSKESTVLDLSENARTRVKVYEMGSSSQWTDKGTGHVVCVFVETLAGFCLIVRSEVDGSVLMNVKLAHDILYQRQEDTLIVWSEPNVGDLALSFQEIVGCSEMWDHIFDIQSRLATNKIDTENLLLREEASVDGIQQMVVDLADPELKNLADIEFTISHSTRSAHVREQLAKFIIETGYIDKLLPLLELCEDLESTSDLFILSSILRSIIFLNDQKILEHILNEEVFTLVVGILEYDKDFPQTKANHREYLERHVHFKQVIPIANEKTIVRIKQTYRVQYLRDVVLARVLDEQTYTLLNSITYFNNLEIVQSFWKDDEFLEKLFSLLSQDHVSAEKKKEVILFLNDLSAMARTIQKQLRSEFYLALGNHGLFTVFEHTLGDTDELVRIASVAILHNILDHDPSLVRSFCLAQVEEGHRPLIDFVIEQFLNEPDSGLRSQISDCLRSILDTSGMDSVNNILVRSLGEANADNFQQLFYNSYCKVLFSPLTQLDKMPLVNQRDGSQVMVLDSRLVSICSHLCDLLCFVITQHAMFIKNFILRERLLRHTALLFRAKESHLRLSALRVLRTFIGTNDQFYYRILVQSDVFGPVFAALIDTRGKPNLFNSACLEFFETVRNAGSSRSIVTHIVEHFHKFFPALAYVDTFKQLHLAYEQQHEQVKNEDQAESATTDKSGADTSKLDKQPLQKDGWAKMDMNEEAYFSTFDEEEETVEVDAHATTTEPSTPAPTTESKLPVKRGPLVNYPDDDDDELDLIHTKRQASSKMGSKSTAQKFTISIGGTSENSLHTTDSCTALASNSSTENSSTTHESKGLMLEPLDSSLGSFENTLKKESRSENVESKSVETHSADKMTPLPAASHLNCDPPSTLRLQADHGSTLTSVMELMHQQYHEVLPASTKTSEQDDGMEDGLVGAKGLLTDEADRRPKKARVL
ncbi:hypothetical protein BATDEDRAFT_34430 [Batrachochytrium dendrobatidis JAM81]|uniref:Uncharacterized protein n=2 Tax=Batrachochytrium dendrobatidis TaxID=109871 RepID=F4NW82_BATDJ|nr:uncharacterized protein BATDEDRAFT_34430 [Batrachochytrium dendrobatidis JAM81]EGF82434.1 hypothetical protein BATDEDRAFT_34430 [Batrachochytrium dendrobatidis JAM81]OAJ39660.1 hypothetical protein BDEG_23489 [Batrachochytrium dendrobatidis JEL423]|eukprot:XP_006676797.1 hypothetical protein BATDEDRAFT_34430 [Batrachochytrium dendrobatidis JAM81]